MKRSMPVIGAVTACVVVVSCVAGALLMKADSGAQAQSRTPTLAPTRSSTATSAPGVTPTPRTSAVWPFEPTPGWTTILDDEFNTPGLPAQWTLYNGSYGDSAHNCAAPSQAQVPGDGYLHLKMQYLTKGVCGAGWYTGGMQVNPEYGGVDQAITVRWRIVPSADPHAVYSHRIIPMRWVDDPHYAWYQGESNYCEGSFLGSCYTYLHYGPNSQQVLHGYLIDLTQWHTWRVEVRDHRVSVFVDNMTKPLWVYNGNEATTPDSSKRTVLQQECPLSGCPSAAYAGDVEDIQIDWITIQNATSAQTGAQAAISSPSQAQMARANPPTGCASAVTGACYEDVAATPMTVTALVGDIAQAMKSTLRRYTPHTG